MKQLQSADPSMRGAAKAELLERPEPALLPALLNLLPSSQGTIRDDLLEILAKYDDQRKIPVFLALRKSSPWDRSSVAIDDQLSRLGPSAARALLAGCAGQGEEYGRWVAGVLHLMQKPGLPFIIEALLDNNDCRRQIGQTGLQWAFGEADPQSVLNADIRLASDAATDPDDHISGAAKRWFGSWKGREDSLDISGIVEALIAEYQSNVPPETRVRIAEMLSDIERPRVTRFMRAAINAPNPEIQRIAKQYLSTYPPKPASGRSRAASKARTPEQKIAFLRKLTNSEEDDVNPQILPFLKDADENVRAAAAEVLGDLNAPSMNGRDQGNQETALPALRGALKDPSPRVRASAAQSLGNIHSVEDVELLIAVLKDTDESVVLSATDALGNAPSDTSVPALTAIYHSDKSSSDLRKRALVSLESICNPDSLGIFLDDLKAGGNAPSINTSMALDCVLKKRPDPAAFAPILQSLQSLGPEQRSLFVQAGLIHALGATKNPEAVAPLVDLLKSPSSDVRRWAAEGMGLLGDARAITPLAGVLKDPDSSLRISAAAALSGFSNFSPPPELFAALKDADPTVRLHSAKALAMSHDLKAIEALVSAMPTDFTAIYALGESHDVRAVPQICAFLQDPANKSEGRAAAATALGKLSDARAVDPLIATLNEDNSGITMAASGALGQLKDKRAIEPLKQAFARWNTGQRPNADTVKVWITQALSEFGITDMQAR